ncbi:Serine/threonine-protein kinase Nek3 [Pleodorina starrii]|uniref:non-specific serine/threonine protein kinase n=1 Tax=Pleodorina starrii TaxID=330485 RepID=A0A9W6BRH2_9CHLO|nr:Serine/threonine-protein kinase Nek3 [Pleodorina starrii]GLC56181.1 Serine/threonine-protein kinase Nek3 [Pleodorina starrii]GLC74933.1 Serine/threonine-protein kinase Nek3 [Pleodorina starrii]
MQNYLVVKKLGTGTYGAAYLVSLRANPAQQYVLKKVKVDGPDSSADSEVKVLRSLSHPLVLSYVDHFMYKGHLCIVTEYCDAGDLYQLLRARKAALSEPHLLDLFAQVLLAIQHVHSKNILHRDLKTQNIFLTSGGSIRLGDFGISRPLNGTMDLASTIIGTPYYMSPEVMSSMPYDFKSDMWSLGCVLYEMMSLKHAFDATDMSSLVMKILRGEHLPIPQGFSQELKDLVRQLLCKNPKMRPAPEQILKMPFLKEYVARARETVAQLEQQRGVRGGRGGGGRTTEPGQLAPGAPSFHRHSYSTGAGSDPAPGPSGGSAALSPSQLDRALEAANDRLRRIQLEREALMKQAHGAGQGSPVAPPNGSPVSRRFSASPHQAQSPALAGQASETSLGIGGRANVALAGGSGSGMSPGGGAAGASGLSGKSWREKEEALQRLQARSSQRDLPMQLSGPLQQPGGQFQHGPLLPHLAGDVDSALERHREQRQLRSSRPQSPEYAGMGGAGGPGQFGGGSPPTASAAAAAAAMDPKTRMKARKEEEARRREAELLQARKVYFEERKQAAARLQQLYTPSPSNQVASTARRVTDSSPLSLHGGISLSGEYHSVQQQPQHAHYSSPHHLHHTNSTVSHSGGVDGAMMLVRESSGEVGSALGGPQLSYYGGGGVGPPLPRGAACPDVSDSDDDLEYGEGCAMQEFEAELVNTAAGSSGVSSPTAAPSTAVASPQLQQALDRGDLADRILALREVCAFNLGQPLYELIYGYIRKRMAQGVTDDAAFRQELFQRLGPGRMQYVHLIDQLIYFEDMHGLQSALM